MTAGSGLYIVTLTNDMPISVNANDPRIADECIKVARGHCKFGKAKRLAARKKNYDKVFGDSNVHFWPIVELDEIASAERIVLARLCEWRMRGRTGRRNEWLEGIAPDEVERIAIGALIDARIPFRHIGSVGLERAAEATTCGG